MLLQKYKKTAIRNNHSSNLIHEKSIDKAYLGKFYRESRRVIVNTNNDFITNSIYLIYFQNNELV